MQDAPPDILITNYSMLNIMLMRDIEASIFDMTRQWLSDDPSNVFHLVVDELHSYRGTPGTEVGYILRVLYERLGFIPIIRSCGLLASSASLGEMSRARPGLSAAVLWPLAAFRLIRGGALAAGGRSVRQAARSCAGPLTSLGAIRGEWQASLIRQRYIVCLRQSGSTSRR